jgi:deoxyribose-phosphate aldolase
MTEHDQFAELVSRITSDVLRGMGYDTASPAAAPAGRSNGNGNAPAADRGGGHTLSSGDACSVDASGYGSCPRVLPQQVQDWVDAGAARIGAGFESLDALRSRLAGLIDHTLLKPQATHDELRKLCAEAKRYRFASVCVNAGNVPFCVRELAGSGVPVAAVVGFPLGATTPEVKALETRQAVDNGAGEIDMVLNVGALKDRDHQLILEEIACVVRAARGHIVKVILETGMLDDIEKVAACALSKAAGAHYVKTSTGFSPGGAKVEDIALMRLVVGPRFGVKASGAIRDQETALSMIQAGATRLGASSSIEIVEGRKSSSSY